MRVSIEELQVNLGEVFELAEGERVLRVEGHPTKPDRRFVEVLRVEKDPPIRDGSTGA